MTAPFFNDTLCLGDNFINYEILDNGPLRITFRLTYEPYFAGNNEIVETRVISLDAYSYFNRVTNIFYTNREIIDLATGIVIPEENPEMVEIGRAHVELQSRPHLVCRLLLEKKKKNKNKI